MTSTLEKALGQETGAGEGVGWANDLARRRQAGPRMIHHRSVPDSCGPATKAVHAGTFVDASTGSVTTPIFPNTTSLFSKHTYRSFSEGTSRDVPIYARYGSINQWSVQEKVAALEGAESAVVFASGMAAIASTLQALTNRGGHIISSYDVYGGTYNFLREDAPQIGREVTLVDGTDIESVRAAIRDNTQLFFFETLSNPLLKPLPLRALAALAHEHHILLVVDSTFLPPPVLHPLRFGADVVIHSASKYLNGHSDLIAGVAAGSRKYMDRIWAQMLKLGGCMDAHACFLLERGMKTLPLRVRTHCSNARRLAEFLTQHPKVSRVHYPTAGEPTQAALELCERGGGGMLGFEVVGGDDAALRMLAHLNIPAVATSLGGVESLVSLPFNTSHSSLTDMQRQQVGIRPGLVRFSVGIEDFEDLRADLEQALAAI